MWRNGRRSGLKIRRPQKRVSSSLTIGTNDFKSKQLGFFYYRKFWRRKAFEKGEEIMRINKYIASCGYASRRKAEELIISGRVKVNEKVVTDLSTIILENDIVKIDEKEISPEEKKIYIILNKPAGYISAVTDDRGRKTVVDLIEGIDLRIFPVGRLDFDTEGIMILTNDGDLANQIIHPSNQIRKKYYVRLDGNLTEENIEHLESGVDIGGYTTGYAKIERVHNEIKNECYITIEEGKNRQVRRMFETQKLSVIYLKRVSIGELTLGSMRAGEFEFLSSDELKKRIGI